MTLVNSVCWPYFTDNATDASGLIFFFFFVERVPCDQDLN